MTQDDAKERCRIARMLAKGHINPAYVGDLNSLDVDLVAESNAPTDIEYQYFALLGPLNKEHETEYMTVGDILLEKKPGGQVIVKRNRKRIGEITAQGLHEAADLGDDLLSELWAEEQEK
ncbi:hypothetical protein [Haloterrigena alkaliphila]|uniref:Uncharacterized protein n=1 Tax=Haloterrigena alkaliphila TaxID=2816475 RepID=A0A8A2VHJ3_9EURY|nr:hypothetical protein [Haloterrigena alkaliphila]QSW99792.1 hypothetical protein J0X25_02185 [Haloterrigena alkaliphila]